MYILNKPSEYDKLMVELIRYFQSLVGLDALRKSEGI